MLMTHYATQSILRYSVVHPDQCCSVWMHNSKTKTHCNNHCCNYFTTRENISNQTGVLHYSNNSSSKEQLSSKRRIILPVMKSQALTTVNCLPLGIPARQEQSLGAGWEIRHFFWMCLSCVENGLFSSTTDFYHNSSKPLMCITDGPFYTWSVEKQLLKDWKCITFMWTHHIILITSNAKVSCPRQERRIT